MQRGIYVFLDLIDFPEVFWILTSANTVTYTNLQANMRSIKKEEEEVNKKGY